MLNCRKRHAMRLDDLGTTARAKRKHNAMIPNLFYCSWSQDGNFIHYYSTNKSILSGSATIHHWNVCPITPWCLKISILGTDPSTQENKTTRFYVPTKDHRLLYGRLNVLEGPGKLKWPVYTLLPIHPGLTPAWYSFPILGYMLLEFMFLGADTLLLDALGCLLAVASWFVSIVPSLYQSRDHSWFSSSSDGTPHHKSIQK